MCTAIQNHCPSCCRNHGLVYRRPCPIAYEFRPRAFFSVIHSIDESNAKIALAMCDNCERGRQSANCGKSASRPSCLSSTTSRNKRQIFPNGPARPARHAWPARDDEEEPLRIVSRFRRY